MMNQPQQALRIPWMGIPVAMWAGSLALDMASIWLGNVAVREAFYCVSGGLAAAILIGATTALSYNRALAGSRVVRLTALHGFVLISTLIIFALNAWARAAWYDAPVTPFGGVLLTGLGLMFVAFGSFLSRQVVLDERGTIRAPQEATRRPPR